MSASDVLRKVSASDALEVAGFLIITVGVAFVWWPAALMLLGLGLLFAGWAMDGRDSGGGQ